MFPVSYYREMRCCSLELTNDQRDCMMKGQIIAMTNTSDLTMCSTSVTPEHRQRERSVYCHQGKTICRTKFLFIHNIGYSIYKALRRRRRYQATKRTTRTKCTTIASPVKRVPRALRARTREEEKMLRERAGFIVSLRTFRFTRFSVYVNLYVYIIIIMIT